jgi:hypothetical protein
MLFLANKYTNIQRDGPLKPCLPAQIYDFASICACSSAGKYVYLLSMKAGKRAGDQ